MSVLAKLFFDNDDEDESEQNVYTILECSFDFNVATDRRGKRTELIRGGLISLVLESNQKDDFLLWIKDPEENRDGHITFYEDDWMTSGMKLHFAGADCIQYSEEFKADSIRPMTTRIVIAPFMIAIGDTDVFLWEDLDKQKKHKKRKRKPREKAKENEDNKDNIRREQERLGVKPDGIWGPESKQTSQKDKSNDDPGRASIGTR